MRRGASCTDPWGGAASRFSRGPLSCVRQSLGRREVGDAVRSPEERDGAISVFVQANLGPHEVRPERACRHRNADPLAPAPAEARPGHGAARRGDRGGQRRAVRPDRADGARSVRLADPRHRVDLQLLRTRCLGRGGPRPEDGRGRAGDSKPAAPMFRTRRDDGRSGKAQPAADLRHDRRRADGGGNGRRACRAGQGDARSGFREHRSDQCPYRARGGGPRLLAGFPEEQSAYSERALRELGVEGQTGSPRTSAISACASGVSGSKRRP